MGVEVNKNWLRIRFTHQGQRYCFNLGLKDTKPNKVKAASVLLQIEADIEEGKFDSSLAKYKPHPTLNKPLNALTCPELFAEWVKWKSAFCDDRTVKWLAAMGKPLSHFEHLPASSISQKQAKDFAALLSSQAKGDTQCRRLSVIKSCWEWAIENNYLSKNPWRETNKLIKASPKQMPKPFTKKEVEAILAGFQENYPELHPFVRFLLGTGCRLGEARALRWLDLSNDFTCCEIATQISQNTKKRKLPKNNKIRSLTLSNSLTDMLRELNSISGGGDTIFQLNCLPIKETDFYYRWRRVLSLKKIPYRKPYNCRHTFVSHALAKGISPPSISQITGHTLKVLFAHYAGYIDANPKLPELF